MSSARILLTGFGLIIGALSITAAEPENTNWPQFRGADSRGLGASDRPPIEWSTEKNVAWRVDVPGRGWSSPIVWGDHIFLTTAVSDGAMEEPKKGLYMGGDRPKPSSAQHHWLLLCLERETGKTLWSRELHAAPPVTPIHIKNSYASETPVTDGERVYAYFGSIGLFCVDFKGAIVWTQKFEPRRMQSGWGTSASPVLHGDRIFVVNDNEEASFLAAYDKRTGKELWRQPRDEKSNFTTPYVWQNEKRTELVVTGRKQVRSYDLDGKLLWSLKGLSQIVIPMPFAADGLLYLCAGYVLDTSRPNKPAYAIRPGGSGDISPPDGKREGEFVAWMETNAAPYNPSALVTEGRFYVVWDFGFLSCRSAKTGAELYSKQRLKTDGAASFTASPWSYRGRVFCLSEDGETFVVPVGDKYELERVNALGEMCMATPAISGDRLFIRTLSKLYCLRQRE